MDFDAPKLVIWNSIRNFHWLLFNPVTVVPLVYVHIQQRYGIVILPTPLANQPSGALAAQAGGQALEDHQVRIHEASSFPPAFALQVYEELDGRPQVMLHSMG